MNCSIGTIYNTVSLYLKTWLQMFFKYLWLKFLSALLFICTDWSVFFFLCLCRMGFLVVVVKCRFPRKILKQNDKMIWNINVNSTIRINPKIWISLWTVIKYAKSFRRQKVVKMCVCHFDCYYSKGDFKSVKISHQIKRFRQPICFIFKWVNILEKD